MSARGRAGRTVTRRIVAETPGCQWASGLLSAVRRATPLLASHPRDEGANTSGGAGKFQAMASYAASDREDVSGCPFPLPLFCTAPFVSIARAPGTVPVTKHTADGRCIARQAPAVGELPLLKGHFVLGPQEGGLEIATNTRWVSIRPPPGDPPHVHTPAISRQRISARSLENPPGETRHELCPLNERVSRNACRVGHLGT